LPHAARAAIGRWTRARVVAGPWQMLTGPVTATALQAVALWAWHAPRLFGLALANEGWHVVQHLSFLLTALLFWTAMLERRRMQHHPALVIGCLFATATVSGALGALMAFSSSPWYAGYAALGVTPLGLTPVEDQQVAGLLMWIPGGLVHAGAALAILARCLRQPRHGRAPWLGIAR
jgi:cytochrome c oxidase assembly factor CtaG